MGRHLYTQILWGVVLGAEHTGWAHADQKRVLDWWPAGLEKHDDFVLQADQLYGFVRDTWVLPADGLQVSLYGPDDHKHLALGFLAYDSPYPGGWHAVMDRMPEQQAHWEPALQHVLKELDFTPARPPSWLITGSYG